MKQEVNFQLKAGQDRSLPFEMTSEEMKQCEKEPRKPRRSRIVRRGSVVIDEGTKFAEAGKHEEAIEKFKQALEKDPEQTNMMEICGILQET